MFSIQTIKHSEATKYDLDRAIAIKQTAWPYPKESQLLWMHDNLHPEDLHIFLLEDGKDVAYLNIAWVKACINDQDVICAGIGNVCTKIKMGGYGKALMDCVIHILQKNNQAGILFCRDALVGFYSKCKWCLVNPKRVTLPQKIEGVNTMVYNVNDVNSIVYNDRNF